MPGLLGLMEEGVSGISYKSDKCSQATAAKNLSGCSTGALREKVTGTKAKLDESDYESEVTPDQFASSGLDPLAAKQRTGSFLEHSTPWIQWTFALSRSQKPLLQTALHDAQSFRGASWVTTSVLKRPAMTNRRGAVHSLGYAQVKL